MRIVEGEEEVTGVPAASDADTIRGGGWIARRTADGFMLQYDAGEIQSRDRVLPISAADFDRLRRDPQAFEAIVHAHGG